MKHPPRQSSIRLHRRLLILPVLLGLLLSSTGLAATGTVLPEKVRTTPQAGIRDREGLCYALINARVIPQGGSELEKATLVIEDGLIRQLGPNVDAPAHAEVIDMQGKTIYPALIDAYTSLDYSPDRSESAHWNRHIRPERQAAAGWKRSAATDKQFRQAGFALRLLVPSGHIMKGTSAVVTTGEGDEAASIVNRLAAQHMRLAAASGSNYPDSPMGAVALARQTMYDTQWYQQAWRVYRQAKAPRPEFNLALDTLSAALDADTLILFDAPDEQYVLRAARFAREFQLNNIAIRGSGREYQRLQAVVDLDCPLVIPVDFPRPPNVATPEAALDASLSELMHWHLAPTNPARLTDAGATICLTTYGLKKRSDFRKQVRLAVERGLAPADALNACTSVPAELLGVAAKAGTLAVGKAAHLMITDGDWLDKDTKILETWVDGQRFQHQYRAPHGTAGTWSLTLEQQADQAESSEQQADSKRPATLFLQLTESEQGKKLSGRVALTAEAARAKPATASKKEVQQEDEDAGQKAKDDHDHADHDHDHADHAHGDDEEHEDEEADSASDEPTTADTDDEDDDDAKGDAQKLTNLHGSFGQVSGRFSAKLWGSQGTVRLSGTMAGGQLMGWLLDEHGHQVRFVADKLDDSASSESSEQDAAVEAKKASEDEASGDADANDEADEDAPIAVNYPLGAAGVAAPLQATGPVLFSGATVWTCNEAGEILRDADVLVVDGRIAAVGKDLDVPEGTQHIQLNGKHLTPGIIDCHSHMATDGGINEGTQAITAEVRIGDFIDATDMAIYRQLAGGVTTANVLHGSANPIGGQNQVIKLRWGQLPEQLKFREAPAGIKFALGENVKQSNWGDDYTSRYPQTRMGVQQIMRDALMAAREYGQRWKRWHETHEGLPPRRDLELDALLQIVEGQRWIHCHSYRQDEILALMRTLESFEITIGTFQHILEGYKVAKEMAAHGAMGSSFSDWWAYKFEVYDAIPYNGALMHKAGVVVSFNSDDRELARHLNHEAAKAMKYGGLPPVEALKFVTLNPAKQLRIAQHVGSIEVGKHADLAVWSDQPLQIRAVCEQTWIDGIRYFDRQRDREQQQQQTKLRRRLVRLILDSGQTMRKPGSKEALYRNLWPRNDEYCGHGHGE